jgi:hypothetical protein
MTTKAPKPSTLLKRALKLFGPRGGRWVQGEYDIRPGEIGYKASYKDGAFCAVGSLMEVNTDRQFEAEVYLDKAAKKVSRNLGATAVWFNDRKGRRFAQIRTLFNTAITLAEKAGE